MTVNGMADVSVIDDARIIREESSPAGKAFLRVRFEDGQTVDMSLTLAEMIGGAGRGAALRFGYTHDKGGIGKMTTQTTDSYKAILEDALELLKEWDTNGLIENQLNSDPHPDRAALVKRKQEHDERTF